MLHHLHGKIGWCGLWGNSIQAPYVYTVWRPGSQAKVPAEVVTQHLQTGCRQGQDVLMLLCSLPCNCGDHLGRGANLSHMTEQP